jgi:hypothetical protein
MASNAPKNAEFHDLKCEACGKSIMRLIVTSQGDSQSRYRADCPFCKDRSDIVLVSGSVCPLPSDGVQIVDMEWVDDKTIFRTMQCKLPDPI